MVMTPDNLISLLKELSEWLEFESAAPVEWVVCGGVALALQNLQLRTTNDVDVLGGWDSEGAELILIDEFPENVRTCIKHVIENHPEFENPNKAWVNLGPARLAKAGLPTGYEERLTVRTFGQNVTLHLLGREDLLALKLLASADELGPRQAIHFSDLQALKPTFDELDHAVDWIKTLPEFEYLRPALHDLVRKLGPPDLAYYI